MKPILRWVGGKTQLLPTIAERVPYDIETYFEPFVGGGAVMLHVLEERKAKNVIASDVNAELINFYLCVKRDPAAVHSSYVTHKNDEGTYYDVRAWDRHEGYAELDPSIRAARFLYLNQASFQGLWRVNTKTGHHNTPFGRRKNIEVPWERIAMFSRAIQEVEFYHMDHAACTQHADRGDFVYMDPPYYPTSPSSSFTEYAKGGFGHDQQVRLRDECRRLRDARVCFLLSQSDCHAVRELYSDFQLDVVNVRRNVAARLSSRGKTTELLISTSSSEPLTRSVVRSEHEHENDQAVSASG